MKIEGPKTFGFARMKQVPAIEGTHAKLCPKCKRWYAAQPRSRICDFCQPRWKLAQRSEQASNQLTEAAHTTTPTRRVSRLVGWSGSRQMALQAASDDQLEGKTFGCMYPKAQQADHTPSARRHPFAGDRPSESGWCAGPCNCACHIRSYEEAITARNVALGLQGV